VKHKDRGHRIGQTADDDDEWSSRGRRFDAQSNDGCAKDREGSVERQSGAVVRSRRVQRCHWRAVDESGARPGSPPSCVKVVGSAAMYQWCGRKTTRIRMVCASRSRLP
jgi:hypothetical protein